MTYFKEIQDYLADLAAKNKLLGHNPPARRTFFRMDNEEDLASIMKDAGSPYVKVVDFTGSMSGDNDRPKRQEVLRLRFAGKIDPAKALSNEIERVQQLAYEVMLQFISRMQEDAEVNGPCGVLKYLQISRASWQPVGPVNQYEYGWEISLPVVIKMPDYNSNDWTA